MSPETEYWLLRLTLLIVAIGSAMTGWGLTSLVSAVYKLRKRVELLEEEIDRQRDYEDEERMNGYER